MGIWGAKLYENDMANDIKIDYEELIEEGKTNEEILNTLYSIYKEEIEDYDEKSVFWMVLADILCEHNNLTDFVKEKALKEIENGENLKIWKEEASKEDYTKRKKEIEKLRKKLIEYKKEEKNVLKKTKKITKRETNKNNEWNIGDTYAYKIKNKKYKDQYLILRKIDNYEYGSIIRYQSAIIYVQITSNKRLPKNEEELNNLEYIITCNEGNVRHQYRMKISTLPRKETDELIYLGNFKNIEAPKDEYIEEIKINMWGHSFKDIEFLLDKLERIGTNRKPIYYEVDPKNISDSHIRFLMRVKYYKELLEIEPPKDAIVKNDPLLFISLVDSLMIGGFVKNPVGIVTEEVKQESYKRINELRNIIKHSKCNNKEEKFNKLNELEKKIRNYNLNI